MIDRKMEISAHGRVKRCFTLIELLVITSHLCCNRMRDVLKKNKAERGSFSPARGQVKLYSFTLIELLVVIAMIAITTNSSIRVNNFFIDPTSLFYR